MRLLGMFGAPLLCAGLWAAAGASPQGQAPVPPARPKGVSFNADIAPIVFARCVTCHQPNGAAFSLLTFADVRPRARQIAHLTKIRAMPPWKPDPGHGDFAGVRRLSDAEIDTIQQWVAEGAHEGDPATRPPTPPLAAGWRLGQPDLIVSMPARYTVPATGDDIYRNFIIPIPLTATRYVKAWELRAGSQVVHHATIQIDTSGLSKRLDTARVESGYEGLLPPTVRMPDGFFLDWGHGHTPSRLADGIAWPLVPGSDLILTLHLRPDGHPQSIQVQIGLYFSPAPPSRLPVMLRLNREDLDIASGNSNYIVEDAYTLPTDVDVYTVQPHAHYLAREVEGLARLPDGTTKSLIAIKDWDFDWQDVYQYAHPLFLPKGTTITMQWRYDNSAANPRNPNRPLRRVIYGQQTADEMCELWYQVVPRHAAERDLLIRSMRAKVLPQEIKGLEMMLSVQADNAALHDDTALLYEEAGDLAGAASHFAQSLRLRPESPAAHFNLGTALLAIGKPDDAARYFRDALRLDPAYGRARRSLASLLQSQGHVDEAMSQYREVLQQNPADEAVHYNLGLLLASQRKGLEATEHFAASLAARPDWPPALIALAWLRATSSDNTVRNPTEALRLVQRAMVLGQSRDVAALDTLAAARAAAGQFDEAVKAAELAVSIASESGNAGTTAIKERLDQYRHGVAYRQP
jgi:tetratricopeptide (TPR) repeat protein